MLDASSVAIAPAEVDSTNAPTLPANALAADQALDLLGLAERQTLAVTGAAGSGGQVGQEGAAGGGRNGGGA